ncbi:hypothetical protein J3459_010812 [Metarhizium acridum]|nr:hypothetical protein J3459_010812 [Metarhizium acridum]
MRKAAAIEANVEWVQEAMDAVNGLLAQGRTGWLKKRRRRRRKRKPFETDDSDSEDENEASTISKKSEKPAKGLNVEINLKLSPGE